MFDSLFDLRMGVLETYREIDRKTARFQSVTGLQCPEPCGICCESKEVEATVIEMLPLAEEILLRKESDLLMERIETKIDSGDRMCALVNRVAGTTVHLRCSYYQYRPLICRLFGYASRNGRSGNKELSICKVIKKSNSNALKRAEIALNQGIDIPVYQECFMRIASMHPGMGYQLLPINYAMKAAIEYLDFRRPVDGMGYTKAA
jgi:Fe-S-cluster containining protein